MYACVRVFRLARRRLEVCGAFMVGLFMFVIDKYPPPTYEGHQADADGAERAIPIDRHLFSMGGRFGARESRTDSLKM